jgi:hypothetical protein
MKPISAETYLDIEHKPDPGAAPMLQWLPIAKLVVDDSYQREIRQTGRKTVRKIAETFLWSKFAPVVVSPIAGGLFAVVDGQHRTTAAALLKIESVPCQVIIASTAEQAAAFHAINGSVTRMTRMQLHAAALVAGDPDAVALEKACASAGVELLRYPLSAEKQQPGQTRCVETIANCMRVFGSDCTIAALRCVTKTSNREVLGLLQSQVIRALCDLLKATPALLISGKLLIEAFEEIDIESAHEAARTQRKAKGEVTATVLARKLLSELQKMPRMAKLLAGKQAA